MDTVSISRERDDAEITDSATTEGPSQEAPQRYVYVLMWVSRFTKLIVRAGVPVSECKSFKWLLLRINRNNERVSFLRYLLIRPTLASVNKGKYNTNRAIG